MHSYSNVSSFLCEDGVSATALCCEKSSSYPQRAGTGRIGGGGTDTGYLLLCVRFDVSIAAAQAVAFTHITADVPVRTATVPLPASGNP